VTANLENGLVTTALVNFGRPFESTEVCVVSKRYKIRFGIKNQGILAISKERDLWANHVGAIWYLFETHTSVELPTIGQNWQIPPNLLYNHRPLLQRPFSRKYFERKRYGFE